MTSPAQTVAYRRFARDTIAMIMRCSLWLADDHLLSVRSTGYTEDYIRIYLKDLKGVVVRQTKTWMVVNISLGILLTLFAIGILRTDDLYSAGTITLMIIGLPFLIAFTVNLAKGPTCQTHLLTPLGLVEIPALRRFRKTARLIKELRPLIASRQGSMLRSELLARYDAGRADVTVPAPATP